MHTLDWEALAEQSLTATRYPQHALAATRRQAAQRLQDEPDAAEEAFWAAEAARGELAGAPDSLPCHACPETPAPLRTVVALGPVGRGPDPWQTYKLACGHTAI